jgi:signal transduction histidine kinase
MDYTEPTTATQRQVDEHSQQLRSMLSVITHDLSSPIRAMIDSADLLRVSTQEKLDEEELHCLALISSEGRRAQDMLKSLSTLSRLMVTPLIPIQIGIDEILKSLSKGSLYTLKVEALPQIDGDMGQWRQLLLELINNAVRFQSPDRPLEIHIRWQQDNDQHMLQIIDNGTGLKERDLERMAMPFFRTQQIANLPGLGMGLAYCDQILKRHGGNLSFSVNVDHGLTVNCHLPHTMVGT